VFQKELNYTADRDASVDYVKEIYARILSGENFDDDDVQELAPADGAAVY